MICKSHYQTCYTFPNAYYAHMATIYPSVLILFPEANKPQYMNILCP